MTNAATDRLSNYDYRLPSDLIAHTPKEPREAARLFVYETATGIVTHKTIGDLPDYLAGNLIVVNDTTVLPARLYGDYQGSRIELLILVDQGITETGIVRSLVNRRVLVGSRITLPSGENFTVLENHDKSMLLKFSASQTALLKYLDESGETPLPPYIKNQHSEAERRLAYQSIFAEAAASVAAPTASLHFTKGLCERLKEQGSEFTPITLQVGLGTFAPIFPENFTAEKLHQEWYSVPPHTAERIKTSLDQGRPITAIGTTVVRTLESSARATKQGQGSANSTDLFIFAPYQFQLTNRLLTNFHVPRSSLLCLVDALLANKKAPHDIMELYQVAIKEQYRFFSYGDAMLIL